MPRAWASPRAWQSWAKTTRASEAGQKTAPREELIEPLAFEELHDEKGHRGARIDPGRDDLDDMLAGDAGRDGGLALEAPPEPRVLQKLGPHHLEGAQNAGAALVHEVHRTHATATDDPVHGEITGEICPRGKLGLVHALVWPGEKAPRPACFTPAPRPA